jgi:sec-independent protein translocase protein TatA
MPGTQIFADLHGRESVKIRENPCPRNPALTSARPIQYSQEGLFPLEIGGSIMFGMSVTELVIVAVVIILIFGVNKIPQLGKGLGEGIRNFKTSLKDAQEEPQNKKDKS